MENYTFDELLALGTKLNQPGSKMTSTSVSLNQKIKEAQEQAEHDADRKSTTPKAGGRDKAISDANAAKAKASSEREANIAKYGTGDVGAIRQVEGQGPFDPNFDFLAKTNPEAAQASLDKVRTTLGIPTAGDVRAKPERIWQGTHDASDGSGEQIPYFTNLPAGAGRMEGVHDLHRYEPSAPATAGVGGDSKERRALARKLDAAENVVKYGPKSEDVVAREAAQHLPEFLADIKKYGKDEAANRQFAKVAAGKLSDAAYKRMHGEASKEAADADAQQFADTRAKYAEHARAFGATDALAKIDEAIANREGDPKHLLAARREIAARARPFASTELLTMPDLYYPYSASDVEQLRKRRAGADAQAAADATKEEAQANLDATVKGAAGTPARTMSSYLGIAHPTPRPQKQSQIVGGAELGYEIGEFPKYPVDAENSVLNWLEGGGNIERGRKMRAKKAARSKE